jgi:hypothetical protein
MRKWALFKVHEIFWKGGLNRNSPKDNSIPAIIVLRGIMLLHTRLIAAKRERFYSKHANCCHFKDPDCFTLLIEPFLLSLLHSLLFSRYKNRPHRPTAR